MALDFYVVIDVELHVVDLLLCMLYYMNPTVESKSVCIIYCGDATLFTVI